MKNQFYLDIVHGKRRQWSSVGTMKSITEIATMLSDCRNDTFRSGCLFVHVNDLGTTAIDAFEEALKKFFSQLNLLWGIVYVTGGTCDEVQARFIKFKEWFDNGGGNRHHLLRYPISTSADQTELESKLSRYLANDDPFEFDLLYEHNVDRDNLIAFRILLDCSVFLVTPQHDAFARVAEEVRQVAARPRDASFWSSYWEPVKKFVTASRATPPNMNALKLPEKEKNALAQCLHHVAERLSGGDGSPDPDAQCIKSYLAERFSA